MKKTDIAMIILIAGVSILVAYIVMNSLLSGFKATPVKVKTMDSISSEVTQPDPAVFNSKAINPTVQVNIGDNGSGQ